MPDEKVTAQKRQVAANIAMAFMQHQKDTQRLAEQMVQVMQMLMQQNQQIMQMLAAPKENRVIRDPQTGDIVGSVQTMTNGSTLQ